MSILCGKISSNYDIGAFKPILPVEGDDLPIFSNMYMKAEISLYHQNSFQCRAILFLALAVF